jgi:hypothetical protein
MTKNYFCILSFFLFGILSSNAQSNAFLKHIDKLEFAKAEKKLSKKYEKEKDDIELNYAYAKLYNSKAYKGYNPYKANDYIVIAIKVLNDLGNEEKVKYSKKGYTIESLSKIKEECYNLAYNDCKDKNTIDCFKNYILYFTNAPEWKIKAQRKIYEIAFNEAEKINTTDSYQKFINDFNSHRMIKICVE